MTTIPPELQEWCKEGVLDAARLPGAYEQMTGRAGGDRPLHATEALIQWLDDLKARNHIMQRRVNLNTLSDWSLDGEGALVHKQGKFFRVIGIHASSTAREVRAWSQPILDNAGTGVIGLLCCRINDTPHFLMQAKAEAGNRSIVQIGPTVQFTRQNYLDNDALTKPYLFDEFSNSSGLTVLRESRQSEEGARFYMEQHAHRILLLPDHRSLEPPDDYRWFSSGQIGYFLHLGEQVNSCARSILACLL